MVCLSVIDAMASTHVHPNLPHAITAELVVTKIAKLDAIDALHKLQFCYRITNDLEPLN